MGQIANRPNRVTPQTRHAAVLTAIPRANLRSLLTRIRGLVDCAAATMRVQQIRRRLDRAQHARTPILIHGSSVMM
jgi:hypothetical protein